MSRKAKPQRVRDMSADPADSEAMPHGSLKSQLQTAVRDLYDGVMTVSVATGILQAADNDFRGASEQYGRLLQVVELFRTQIFHVTSGRVAPLSPVPQLMVNPAIKLPNKGASNPPKVESSSSSANNVANLSRFHVAQATRARAQIAIDPANLGPRTEEQRRKSFIAAICLAIKGCLVPGFKYEQALKLLCEVFEGEYLDVLVDHLARRKITKEFEECKKIVLEVLELVASWFDAKTDGPVRVFFKKNVPLEYAKRFPGDLASHSASQVSEDKLCDDGEKLREVKILAWAEVHQKYVYIVHDIKRAMSSRHMVWIYPFVEEMFREAGLPDECLHKLNTLAYQRLRQSINEFSFDLHDGHPSFQAQLEPLISEVVSRAIDKYSKQLRLGLNTEALEP